MSSLFVTATAPPLTGQALSAGVGVNLTGATLLLHLERPDGTIVIVTPVAVDASVGTWRYDWATPTSELTVAGDWSATLEVTYAGGSRQFFGPDWFPVAVHRSHDGGNGAGVPVDGIDGGAP